MNHRNYFLFLIIISILILSTTNVKSQTDCVIITELDGYKFIKPALTENNSFVYSNFEFRLYSKKYNVTYEIEIDNILIANGTIKELPKIITWKTEKDIIYNINIRIHEDHYNYSNIIVFNTPFGNGTGIIEEDKVTFTKEEFKNYVNELKLKLFSSDGLGWFVGIILAHIYVREIKKSVIVEV